MNITINVSVHSVVTIPLGDLERLEQYLYGHTKVVESHDGERFTFVIVITTSTRTADMDSRNKFALVDEAQRDVFYLANYQLDRLSSGLMGGILAGDYDEAQAVMVEVAR